MRVRRPRPSGRSENGKQTDCGQIGDLGRTTSDDHSETSHSSGRLYPTRHVASECQRGRTRQGAQRQEVRAKATQVRYRRRTVRPHWPKN